MNDICHKEYKGKKNHMSDKMVEKDVEKALSPRSSESRGFMKPATCRLIPTEMDEGVKSD